MPTDIQDAMRFVIGLAIIAWLLREAFLTWHAVELFDARTYRRCIRAVAVIMALLAAIMLGLLIRAALP